MSEGLISKQEGLISKQDAREFDSLKELSFEHGISELEQIVKDLEQKDVPLDEALAGFRRGVELVRYCNFLLDTAEKQIEVLLEGTEGELKTAPLSVSLEG
ncbi:MAG: exodeoxyribonuclease VII small subunit [Desulfitobacterium hafniense]|nr:exodeoxyribonuclease VII small subunit [Desulfitobacterium hafniense]